MVTLKCNSRIFILRKGVDGNGPKLCIMVSFGISSVESLGSTTSELVIKETSVQVDYEETKLG
jgi:hypothetical protein